MDEYSLEENMSKIVNQYAPQTAFAVYAADELKWPHSHQNVAIIQNTKPRGQQGEHYLLWLSNKSGPIEFFDSLGRPITYYQDLKIPNGRLVEANHKQLQSDKSSNCSLFCLYVMKNRLQNRKMESIMMDFSPTRLICNDLLVLRFYSTLKTNLNVRNRKFCI